MLKKKHFRNKKLILIFNASKIFLMPAAFKFLNPTSVRLVLMSVLSAVVVE